MDNRDKDTQNLDRENKENSSTTQFSYKEARENVKKHHRFTRFRKLFFSLTAFASALYLVLYFCLPSFQASNRKVSGLSLFNQEDIVTLSGNEGFKPAIFFQGKTSSKTAIENSGGLLLSLDFETDGFVVHGFAKENGPVARINGKAYFAQGKTYEERKSKLTFLPLSQKRKDEIGKRREAQSSVLPDISFPDGVEENNQNDKLAIDYLSSLPYAILSKISCIKYTSSEDSNWNNLADFLIEDKASGKNYVISNLLRDKLSLYFSSEGKFDYVLSSRKKFAEDQKNNRVTKKFYKSAGDNYPVDAYFFQLVLRNGDSSVDLIQGTDENK